MERRKFFKKKKRKEIPVSILRSAQTYSFAVKFAQFKYLPWFYKTFTYFYLTFVWLFIF